MVLAFGGCREANRAGCGFPEQVSDLIATMPSNWRFDFQKLSGEVTSEFVNPIEASSGQTIGVHVAENTALTVEAARSTTKLPNNLDNWNFAGTLAGDAASTSKVLKSL